MTVLDASRPPVSSAAVRTRTVAFFSFHTWQSKRRGGMHWLCSAFRGMGWDARFITCDYSLVTRLKGDRRTRHGEARGINQLERVAKDLSVGVLFTPWHAMGRPGLAGRILDAVSSTYPWPFGPVVERFAAGTDLVIVESCGGLMFVDRIRAANDAPIVYRVSDNLDVVRPVPSLLAAERAAAAMVDRVSLASEHLARRFAGAPGLAIDPMGIDKSLFDRPSATPYASDSRPKVVISGSSGQDDESLAAAASARPDCDFVQFGSVARQLDAPNIRYMGETPFEALVPYVQHADVGFAPYRVRPGFEYQADHSNRLLQYVYSGLPSVVPQELCLPGRPHMIGYRAGDRASLGAAIGAALAFDRAAVPRSSVIDWTELARRLAATERRR